jgi:hypothetical protein
MHKSIEISALYAASIEVLDAICTFSVGNHRIASTSLQEPHNTVTSGDEKCRSEGL